VRGEKGKLGSVDLFRMNILLFLLLGHNLTAVITGLLKQDASEWSPESPLQVLVHGQDTSGLNEL
jgi:hypothetical protein